MSRALLVLLAAGIALHAQEARRHALIVSNANYGSIASLPGVTSGAALLRPVLRQLRFEIAEIKDANLDDMDNAVSKLAADTRRGDVVLAIYLGLAAQVNQENYFLPAAFAPSKNQCDGYACYSMRRLASLIDAKQPAFFALIVDAAWDLPLLRQHFPEPGLARMEPGPNSLFAMSASPGRVFGDGSKSLYASALAEALSLEGVTLSQITDRIKRTVSESSGGAQLPSEASTVVRDFYVNPRPADAVAWDAVKDKQDLGALEAFVKAHPGSRFAAEAKSRIQDLSWKSASGKDLATLRGFLSANADSPFAANARAEIDALLVAQALSEYKAAMESRDLRLLLKLWPSLDKKQQAKFQGVFREARSIAVEVPFSAPRIANGLSSVAVRQSIQYPGQAAMSSVVNLNLKLAANGEMRIESLGDPAKP